MDDYYDPIEEAEKAGKDPEAQPKAPDDWPKTTPERAPEAPEDD